MRLLASTLLMLAMLSACAPGGEPVMAQADKPTPTAEEEAPRDEAKPAVETVTAEKLAKLIEAEKGKVLVLNLWATWCPPCVAEMPFFVEFYNTRDKNKVAFLSVSADDPSTIDKKVKPFASEKKLPFDVHVLEGRDPAAFNKALKTELSGGLPTTIFYDAKGAVAKVVESDMDLEEIKEMVAQLLPVE